MFDESTIQQQMTALYARNDAEALAFTTALRALGKAEARAHLAIKFKQPELLSNEKAKAYLERSIRDDIKLTVDDIKALAKVEVESLQIAFDLAEFDVSTTKKAYSQLEAQLSFIQTQMRRL